MADPGYQAALLAENRGRAQSQSQLSEQIQQLMNQLQGTGNPYSVMAQLALQHHQNRLGAVNGLAAHGIVNSGDLGYQLGQADRLYGQAAYNAQQAALQQISQMQSGELGTEQNLHQGVLSALQGAWQNFNANPSLYATNPQAPPSPSANAPTAAPSPGHRHVVHALMNPYTTGRKLYG